MNYDLYYEEFLGITNESDFFFESPYRGVPINKSYYYPFLEVEVKGRKIISVTSDIYKKINKNQSYKMIKNEAITKARELSPFYEEKKFYRFVKNSELSIKNNRAILLKKEHKDFFMVSGKNLDPFFKKKKWQNLLPYIDKESAFAQIENEKIVSMCTISDVFCGGGNLNVFTDEKCRGKGFAKNVVSLASNACLRKNILPIYFVNIMNVSSINLAKSLGFELKSIENCISYVK